MHLPAEIFEEIAGAVDDLLVLRSFTLSCHAAQHASQPLLWERLDVTQCRDSEFCLLWFRTNSHLARDVHVITFLRPSDHDPFQAQIWYNFDLLLHLVSQGHKLHAVVVARFQLSLIHTSQIFPDIAAKIGNARLQIINCACDYASFTEICACGASHLLFSAYSYTSNAPSPISHADFSILSLAYDSVNGYFQCPVDTLPAVNLWALTTLQVHIYYNQVPWLQNLLYKCEGTLQMLDCRIAYETKSIGMPINIAQMKQLKSATLTSDVAHSDVLIQSLETIPASLLSLHIILSLDNRSLSDDMKSIPEFLIVPSTVSHLVVSVTKKHPYTRNCVDDQVFASDLRLYLRNVFASTFTDVKILPSNFTLDLPFGDASEPCWVGPRYGCMFP